MIAPVVGERFHFDLDGTTIAGCFVEVDPPHRMLLRWERKGAGTATSATNLIEITLTPANGGTKVGVEFSGLSAEDAAFYPSLWERHLDRIAVALSGVEAAQED